METEELYTKLKDFFPNQIDLMRHLNINACWEYVITKHSTEDVNVKLTFFLIKKNIESPTKWWCLVNGIATGGSTFAILNGHWPWIHLYT